MGRRTEAQALLDDVLRRFSEGFGTAPLQAADELLRDIRIDAS